MGLRQFLLHVALLGHTSNENIALGLALAISTSNIVHRMSGESGFLHLTAADSAIDLDLLRAERFAVWPCPRYLLLRGARA